MISVTRRAGPAHALRNQYLDPLPEPQGLYLENLVSAGVSWSIRRDDREIGYAVTDGDETLVELHLIAGETGRLTAAFDALLQVCNLRRVLAKTFDSDLLFVALSRPAQVSTIGFLYRVIVDPRFEADAQITVRAATQEDIPSLHVLSADFFDSEAEIEAYLRADGLLLYAFRGGEPFGAGVVMRVVEGRDDFDIGVVVHPERRRRGHGAYIIGHLKSWCLEKGWRPICGCAFDNIGSQGALRRAGFAARHRLVEFRM